MNSNQYNPELIEYIQQRWIEASSNLQARRAQYAQAAQQNEEINRKIKVVKTSLYQKLKVIRQSKLNKIIMFKQVKKSLQSWKDNEYGQTITRTETNLFNQAALDMLEMSIENPLKLDSLTAKIQRIKMEFQNKQNLLKDETKKLKLRVSLCEMQYKELVNPAKRKSD